MKKIFTYAVAIILSLGLVSCDKLFESLEGDLTKMTENDMLTEDGINRILAQLYSITPMSTDAFTTGDQSTWDAVGTHGSAYGLGGVSSFWSYTSIRDINKFFETVKNAQIKGIITAEQYKQYVGEAHFIRGYCYFAMVRTLGGIPIVTEPLDALYDYNTNDASKLYIPRSTEKQTWDFVLSELDSAAAGLPETRQATNYRATKYSALGLKARAALYAASVSKYWNNAPLSADQYTAVAAKEAYMEASYADEYYKQCLEACAEIINSGKFYLYGANPANPDVAMQNLIDLFQSRKDGEWIFGKSYSNGISTSGNGFENDKEPAQSPASNYNYGRYSVTLDLVDEFDNYTSSYGKADGTIVTRTDGNETTYASLPSSAYTAFKPLSIPFVEYDSPDQPFLSKDARFKAWVIYPNCNFRGKTIIIQGGIIKSDSKWQVYGVNASETVNGVTYYSYGGPTGTFSGFMSIDQVQDGNFYSTGFGIRKFLDPSKANDYSQSPWYDIRYAEILLNYAEAQVESGQGSAALAKQYLNDVRHRAGFKDDVDLTLANILHEEHVEFAFENKWASVLYRRRAYYNSNTGADPNEGRRHSLIGMVDLRSGSPKYVYVRSNFYFDDADRLPAKYTVNNKEYYKGITNYDKNKIDPNPSQQ